MQFMAAILQPRRHLLMTTVSHSQAIVHGDGAGAPHGMMISPKKKKDGSKIIVEDSEVIRAGEVITLALCLRAWMVM